MQATYTAIAATRSRSISDMNPHKGRVAGGRTSSRIPFHMSSVETTDHKSWDMFRRTVEAARMGVRDTNTKEGENSLPEQGSTSQG
jgi:hypothetical protein